MSAFPCRCGQVQCANLVELMYISCLAHKCRAATPSAVDLVEEFRARECCVRQPSAAHFRTAVEIGGTKGKEALTPARAASAVEHDRRYERYGVQKATIINHGVPSPVSGALAANWDSRRRPVAPLGPPGRRRRVWA